jgi:Family of unknown function (DUF5947)
MTEVRLSVDALGSLRRLSQTRPTAVVEERCEMCATPIGDTHTHVVNLESRALMCTCRPCYLLFTDQDAQLRYRSVPERYLSFPAVAVDARAWDELQIPVGLAFLFHNSVQGRMIAFYPGPAGATESELSLEAWGRMVEHTPELAVLRPDVEALLVRRSEGPGSCYLVPIDACYELVGRLRRVWRGFDGGQEAYRAIEEFFQRVEARSRPAPAMGASGPTT